MSKSGKEYFIPDFSKFPQGIGLIGDAVNGAVQGLTGVTDMTLTGSEPFQSQCYTLWEDIPLCLLSCCLPCCVANQNAEKLSGNPCEAVCLASCLICCLAPCYHSHLRTEYRQKYNLQGSKTMDLLLSCCCGTCVTYQEAIELGKREQYRVPFTRVGANLSAPREQEMTNQQ
eukprot:TRINITY_DN4027_c0_g1_i6.p1 TRINITY_DN4027_c0_g1~~TRINITY_DN4027_c0_g1_i6.p1  ORF type:complete len:172 (-),score=10.79 TRINITY_DN4027_c0_g1_i6:217-732(-)